MHSRTTKRILQKSNEWKMVWTAFVFAKFELQARWCSAKNQVVPSSRWYVELIGLKNPRLNVHHVCFPYSGVHLSAGAENRCCPSQTWWIVLKKPSKYSWHHTTAHLRLTQEVVNAVWTRGSKITTRFETYCGVIQKSSEILRQSGTDGNMM